jgi:hypothetical protein
MGDRVRESYATDNKPMWLLWNGEEYDQRDSKDDAVIRFEAVVSEIQDEASADGEWPIDAGSAPTLWVAYPLMLHTLVSDVDDDGSEVSRSEVVEYPDPVAALTAELEEARRQIKRLTQPQKPPRSLRELISALVVHSAELARCEDLRHLDLALEMPARGAQRRMGDAREKTADLLRNRAVSLTRLSLDLRAIGAELDGLQGQHAEPNASGGPEAPR